MDLNKLIRETERMQRLELDPVTQFVRNHERLAPTLDSLSPMCGLEAVRRLEQEIELAAGPLRALESAVRPLRELQLAGRAFNDIQATVTSPLPGLRSLSSPAPAGELFSGIVDAYALARLRLPRIDPAALTSWFDAGVLTGLGEASDLLDRELPSVTFEDDVVEIDDEAVKLSDVKQVANELLVDLTVPVTAHQIRQFMADVVERLDTQPRSRTMEILTQVLIGVAVFLIGHALQPAVDDARTYLLGDRATVTTGEAKKVSRAVDVSAVLSGGLRITTIEGLVVRALPRRRSARLAELPVLSVVTVVAVRGRSWTLVSYIDPRTKIAVTGWTFSRYLGKFK